MDASTFPPTLNTTRPPFLILTPVCLLMGFAASGYSPQLNPDLIWVVLGALLAHISVNMLNEYQDFKSGLDLVTDRTPFSGGSGGLPEHPQAAGWVLAGAVLSLLCVVIIGVYLSLAYPALWLLGGIGVLLVWFYTSVINRLPYLCLFAPGLGFGVLMVVGTAIVAGLEQPVCVAFGAAVVFLMVNNLLLANQFPDIEADKAHGREHLLIRYGVSAGIRAFNIMTFSVAGLIVMAAMSGVWPQWVLLALIPWALTLKTLTALNQERENIAAAPDALGMNVMATLLTPVVLALALLLSR
ncbi:MAG: prenyltransferase [Pseudomonadota bacterium]|nr:prenyltransferase [Pseudomonadota bacterium]